MTKFVIVTLAFAKQIGVDDLFTLINEKTGHYAIFLYIGILGFAIYEHRGKEELLALIGEKPEPRQEHKQ